MMTVDRYDAVTWGARSWCAVAYMGITGDARAFGRDVSWDGGWYRLRFSSKRFARLVARKARKMSRRRESWRKGPEDERENCNICDKMHRRARRRRHMSVVRMVESTTAEWSVVECTIPF